MNSEILRIKVSRGGGSRAAAAAEHGVTSASGCLAASVPPGAPSRGEGITALPRTKVASCSPASCSPPLQGQIRPIPAQITAEPLRSVLPPVTARLLIQINQQLYSLCCRAASQGVSFSQNKPQRSDHLSCFDVANSLNVTVFVPAVHIASSQRDYKSMKRVFIKAFCERIKRI